MVISNINSIPSTYKYQDFSHSRASFYYDAYLVYLNLNNQLLKNLLFKEKIRYISYFFYF